MYSGNAYPSFLSTARNTINQEHLQAITTADAQAFGASIGYPSSSFNPMMDIESWMCETSRLSDIAMSYSSGGQPPSIGDVRQIVVSERSGSYQMYSDGQPPSINDVGMREPSQSEASCNRYEDSEEHEVQQVISEFNDGVYKRGAIGRSTDVDQKVSSSFGVPHMTFNFMDSTINNGGLLNGQVWAPQQQPQPQPFQRMRTYTKVLKRGAISRSIDVTAYSGYEELKQDLARRFGIEGQLVDGHKNGYKLVYLDHENDVLLVGPDPWEEFVNCVSSIRILSSQEVQQMSLDGY